MKKIVEFDQIIKYYNTLDFRCKIYKLDTILIFNVKRNIVSNLNDIKFNSHDKLIVKFLMKLDKNYNKQVTINKFYKIKNIYIYVLLH